MLEWFQLPSGEYTVIRGDNDIRICETFMDLVRELQEAAGENET